MGYGARAFSSHERRSIREHRRGCALDRYVHRFCTASTTHCSPCLRVETQQRGRREAAIRRTQEQWYPLAASGIPSAPPNWPADTRHIGRQLTGTVSYEESDVIMLMLHVGSRVPGRSAPRGQKRKERERSATPSARESPGPSHNRPRRSTLPRFSSSTQNIHLLAARLDPPRTPAVANSARSPAGPSEDERDNETGPPRTPAVANSAGSPAGPSDDERDNETGARPPSHRRESIHPVATSHLRYLEDVHSVHRAGRQGHRTASRSTEPSASGPVLRSHTSTAANDRVSNTVILR